VRVVESLLVLARDTSAGIPRGEAVNLADVARRVTARVLDGSTGECSFPDEAVVRGDEDLIEIAVQNLLENARKFAEGPQPVRVVLSDEGGASASGGDHARRAHRGPRSASACSTASTVRPRCAHRATATAWASPWPATWPVFTAATCRASPRIPRTRASPCTCPPGAPTRRRLVERNPNTVARGLPAVLFASILGSKEQLALRHARSLLVLLLWPGLAAAQTSAPPAISPSASAEAAPVTLEDALALARSNPAITAARLRRAVDQAGIEIARERPNPEARYEHTNELPRDAISVAQLIELGGKRGHRIALAEATARTGEAELAQTEAEVWADVYLAFFGLAGTQRRLEVARELSQIAARAREAASARYEVGDVSRLDVLQADLALYQAENDAAAVEGEQAGGAGRAQRAHRPGRRRAHRGRRARRTRPSRPRGRDR
jgi:hypothetical protein